MAKGDRRGLVRFRKPLPKTDTPVKDRLREIIASRNNSSESVDASQPPTPPTSVIETIGSWITGRDPSCNTRDEAMSSGSINAVAIPGSPTPLSKKARKRIKKRGNQSTEIEPSTPIYEGTSSILDDTGPQLHLDTPRTTSFQSMDGSVDSFPTKALHGSYDLQHPHGWVEKRDSVISSNWEGNKNDETLQIMTGRDCTIKNWRKIVKPSAWWPCQLYRWLRKIILAVVRSFQGHRRADLFLSLALLLVCTYVAYAALDFVLCDLIKGVKAQDIAEPTNCSVVYVTVPGPVITVSLIAGTTPDPVQNTYSYSVISGTTERPGSIAPSGLSDDPATRSPALTSGLSSFPSFTSSIQVSPSTFGPPILPSPYPSVETTFITTISSGNTIMISTVTLLPSSVILSSVPPNTPVTPSASSSNTNAPIAQPSQTYSSFIVSTTPLIPSIATSTTVLLTNTMGISTSSPPSQGPGLSSSPVGPLGPAISNSIISSPLVSDRSFTNDPAAMSSTTLLVTNSVPGGSATILTTTSMFLISGAPSNIVPSSNSLPLQSSTIIIATTLPNDQTISTPSLDDPSTSISLDTSSSVGSLASPDLPVAVTSAMSDGRTTILTLFPTNVPSAAPPAATSLGVITASPTTLATTVSGGQATTSTEMMTTNNGGATSSPNSSLLSTVTNEDPSIPTSSAMMFSSASFTTSLMEPVSSTIASALTTIVTSTSSGQITTITVTISPIGSIIDGSSSALPTLIPFPDNSRSFSAPLQSSSTKAPWPAAPSSISAPSPLSSSTVLVTTVSFPTTILSASSISYPSSWPVISTPLSSMALDPSAVVSESLASSPASSLVISPSPSNVTPISPTASFTVPLADPSSASDARPPFFSSWPDVMSTLSVTVITRTSVGSSSSTTAAAIIPGFNFSISSIQLTSSSSFANASTIAGLPVSTSNLGLNISSSSRVTPTASAAVPITNSSSIITLISSTAWSSITPGPSILNSSLSLTTNSSITVSVVPSSNSINTTSTTLSSAVSNIFLSPSSIQNGNRTVNFTATLGPSGGLSAPTGAPAAASSASALLSRRTSTITLTTSLAVITSAPPSGRNMTSALQVRALITRVVSYGDTSVVFVFPTPTIVTTITYWTGTYPTVTGPEPSDIQTIPLTTRSIIQTPLSELSSVGLFASTPTSFRTVVNTIVRDAVTQTQTKKVPAAEPTDCGEYGNFTLSFDDTTVGTNASELLEVNGMKNPYHHLFYANGFTYVPDKWEPYPAISQPNVAMFLPLAGRLLPNTAFAGTLLPGEIGAGPRASVSAYWFNAYSGFFGCALNGLAPCILRISGYRYDEALKQEVLVAEQNATLPACLGYVNCQLTQIFFNEQFIALSGIQFSAFTYDLGIPQVHMMDDLQMEWWNNTCSAGILRIGRL